MFEIIRRHCLREIVFELLYNETGLLLWTTIASTGTDCCRGTSTQQTCSKDAILNWKLICDGLKVIAAAVLCYKACDFEIYFEHLEDFDF